jgi:hypothetical protein
MMFPSDLWMATRLPRLPENRLAYFPVWATTGWPRPTGFSLFPWGGIRRKNCELFIMQHHPEKEYEARIVEQGIGPSNVAVVNGDGRDFIISANYTRNHAAVYVVSD